MQYSLRRIARLRKKARTTQVAPDISLGSMHRRPAGYHATSHAHNLHDRPVGKQAA
jgi:hypothetical protein